MRHYAYEGLNMKTIYIILSLIGFILFAFDNDTNTLIFAVFYFLLSALCRIERKIEKYLKELNEPKKELNEPKVYYPKDSLN